VRRRASILRASAAAAGRGDSSTERRDAKVTGAQSAASRRLPERLQRLRPLSAWARRRPARFRPRISAPPDRGTASTSCILPSAPHGRSEHGFAVARSKPPPSWLRCRPLLAAPELPLSSNPARAPSPVALTLAPLRADVIFVVAAARRFELRHRWFLDRPRACRSPLAGRPASASARRACWMNVSVVCADAADEFRVEMRRRSTRRAREPEGVPAVRTPAELWFRETTARSGAFEVMGLSGL
jgi:hypothetical protein